MNELHKPVRRRFDKRTVFAKQVDDIWRADLVDMLSFSGSNKGYKYFLTVIDVFSKYGWIVPLKRGCTGVSEIVPPCSPSRLWTDKGTDFYNKQLLAGNNLTLYSTANEEKSSIVERWNRTMKNIMWKSFTANNTQKYIDVLPSIVEKYNNTYHRSGKLTPSDARNPANYQHVHYAFYEQELQLSAQEIFRIERVLKKKKKQVFVKWKGYSDAFNSWVPLTDLEA